MISTGTVLAGRYRIEQHIASGGMGDVWQGYDRVLGRTVAVKCLRAPAIEPSFVDRFRSEARTLATISHPGVVEVYEFGEDPVAGVYLVMKYVDGESLAHTLAREERLTVEATMRLVAEAAEALHAAHEKGVIHRDVKPSNLLLCRDGSTMLSDLGVARSETAVGHTLTGSLLGTASYIAPERAAGQPATARSDIYSLGVVAYQCLTGQPPFVGDSPLQLALRHADEEPPPLPAEVPPGVQEVVERAMAKDPAARWPSGAVLAAAARRAMAPAQPGRRVRPALPGGIARACSRLGRPMVSVAGAAALAIAVVATSVAILGHHPGTDGVVADPGATVVAGGTIPGAVPGAGSPTAAGTTGPNATASATRSASPSGTSGPTRAAGTALPEMPSGLTATPVSATTIRLQWMDNSANESGFTVINGAMSRNAGANATTFDWEGLAPGTSTCFKVRAFNSAGASAFDPLAQEGICATSLSGTGPAAPSDLLAAPDNSNTIRLTWTDSSNNESGFTITTAGGTSQTVGANTTTFFWGGLAPGTTVCFRIRSFNSTGISAYDPATQQAPACATTPNTA